MKDGELVKLLGVLFGLNLNAKEVDFFFIEKLWKKFKYYNTIHLPFIGRVVVVNFVLASTQWFFIRVLGEV